MKTKCLSLLFFLWAGICSAQIYKPSVTVTIDPQSGLADREAPFDMEFTLSIPIDSAFKKENISDLIIYRAKTQNGKYWIDTYSSSEAKQFNKALAEATKEKTSFPPCYPNYRADVSDSSPYIHYLISPHSFKEKCIALEIDEKKGASHNELKINVPPLKPCQSYIPIVTFLLDPKTISDLHETNRLLHKGDTAKARQYYESNILYKLRPINNIGIEPLGYTFHEYSCFFHTILKYEIDSTTSLPSAQTVKTQLEKISQSPTLPLLINRINCCKCADNVFWSEKTLVLQTQASITNFLLFSDSTYYANSIAYGISMLKSPSIKKKEGDIIGRLGNIQSGLADVKSLISLIDILLGFKNDACPIPTDSALIALRTDLHKLDAAMKTVKEDLTQRVANINDYYNRPGSRFKIKKIYYGNNTARDIRTAGGSYLQPDIGVAVMVPLDRNTQSLPLVRPYFGVNIGIFGPINKQQSHNRDIPHKTVRHYLSMNIGFTAIPLESERREDIRDLMKSFSFIHGLAYRPYRAFRISGGYVLYRRNDPNPLISTGKITAMPYLSFAIDMDLWEYFGKATGKAF